MRLTIGGDVSVKDECAKLFGNISPKRNITTVVITVAKDIERVPQSLVDITVANVAQAILTTLFPISNTDKASSKLSSI